MRTLCLKHTKGCSGTYNSSDDNIHSNNIAGNSLDLIDDADMGIHYAPDYDATESIRSIGRDLLDQITIYVFYLLAIVVIITTIYPMLHLQRHTSTLCS